MVDKDFLNQFSDEANKPTSFKEEERIKDHKSDIERGSVKADPRFSEDKP